MCSWCTMLHHVVPCHVGPGLGLAERSFFQWGHQQALWGAGQTRRFGTNAAWLGFKTCQSLGFLLHLKWTFHGIWWTLNEVKQLKISWKFHEFQMSKQLLTKSDLNIYLNYLTSQEPKDETSSDEAVTVVKVFTGFSFWSAPVGILQIHIQNITWIQYQVFDSVIFSLKLSIAWCVTFGTFIYIYIYTAVFFLLNLIDILTLKQGRAQNIFGFAGEGSTRSWDAWCAWRVISSWSSSVLKHVTWLNIGRGEPTCMLLSIHYEPSSLISDMSATHTHS